MFPRDTSHLEDFKMIMTPFTTLVLLRKIKINHLPGNPVTKKRSSSLAQTLRADVRKMCARRVRRDFAAKISSAGSWILSEYARAICCDLLLGVYKVCARSPNHRQIEVDWIRMAQA